MHILMNNIAIYRGDIPTFRSNALWRTLDLLMSISTRETCSQRRRSEASRILAAVTIFKNIYFNVTICKVVVMGCLIIGIDILSSKKNEKVEGKFPFSKCLWNSSSSWTLLPIWQWYAQAKCLWISDDTSTKSYEIYEKILILI